MSYGDLCCDVRCALLSCVPCQCASLPHPGEHVDITIVCFPQPCFVDVMTSIFIGALSSSTGEYVDITIMRFGASLRRCRVGQTGLGADGDIINIDVGDGTPTEGDLSFWLPVDEAVAGRAGCGSGGSGDVGTCQWWDPLVQDWSTEGCESDGSVVERSPGNYAIRVRGFFPIAAPPHDFSLS